MADPVAIPAEIGDSLRELGPAFGEFAELIENVLPVVSEWIPALEGVIGTLVDFQPELLAVIEVLKYFGPVLSKIGGYLGAELQPIFQSLGEVLTSLLLPTIKLLKPALDDLAKLFKFLAFIIDPLGSSSDALKKQFQSLKDGLASFFRALGSAASALVSTLGKLASALASLAGSLFSAFRAAVVDPLARAIGSLVRTVADTVRVFLSASFGMQGTTNALRLMSGAMERFIGGITGGVEAVGRAITPFVQALNPNLIFGLQYAFRSLQATIGVALVPVAQVLTNTIRQMAAALLPAAQALAPVLGRLASIISGFVVNTVQRFAQNLQDLLPFLDHLVDAFGVFMGAWEGVRATIFAFIDSLANWLKGLLGAGGKTTNWLDTFRSVLQRAVEAVIKFAAWLARSFGFGDFVSNLRTQLTKLSEPVKGSGAPPAPAEIGFKSFDDIAKTMAAAAFGAQGGGKAAEEKNEREWLKQLADSLDEMKEDGKTVQDYLAEYLEPIQEGVNKTVEEAMRIVEEARKTWEEIQAAKKEVLQFWKDAKDTYGQAATAVHNTVDTVSNAASAAGNFALGLIPGSELFR